MFGTTGFALPEFGYGLTERALEFSGDSRWNRSWFTTENEFELNRDSSVPMPGLYYHEWGGIRALCCRHWFIVTLFALFYGVLKWVYRKRGKAVADV